MYPASFGHANRISFPFEIRVPVQHITRKDEKRTAVLKFQLQNESEGDVVFSFAKDPMKISPY